jgi:hypothetical protein
MYLPDDILSGKVEMINRNISVIGSGLTGLQQNILQKWQYSYSL